MVFREKNDFLGFPKEATTMVYLHLTTADLTKVVSPFDHLKVFNG